MTTLTRRKFLRLAAASTAVAGFPTIIPARVLGAEAPSKLIHIGQIGCGRIARDMDIPGILKHPNLARIIAVADYDASRATDGTKLIQDRYAKAGHQVEVKVHKDYHEMLDRKDIDAVVISTPDHWHAQPVIEAAFAGKDIWVQKPLTLTVPEGRLVSDVVRSKNRILQIGSQQRSGQHFHRAVSLVRNGRVGKLRSIQIGLPIDPAGGRGESMPVPAPLNYDAWLGSTPKVEYTEDRVHPQKGYGRPGWLRLNEYTCGMITGWGSHHVDIAHWGMDSELTGPTEIDAKATFPGADSLWNVHGKYSIHLKYANGVAMHISDELPNGIRFEGSDGWIWVSRGATKLTDKDGKPMTLKSLDASNPALLEGEAGRVKLHESPRWDHHLDWLTAVRDRTQPVTNVETGHRSNTACVISWIAMKLGRKVTWDAAKERFTDEAANALLRREERAPYGAFRAAARAGFQARV
jgi:myo-inositol 2-dehydrogenase/D-chiro-inositol 1-dehydrogenase